jgi:hypothetical protein
MIYGTLSSQTLLKVEIDHRINDQPFGWNVVGTNNLDMDFNFSRMEYYMSGFSVTYDGGQVAEFSDVYALVNANVPQTIEIGEIDANQIEMVSFHIGVDEGNNHSDPASWPSGHPLAPTFPSMHWGWVAGYRFNAIEGQLVDINEEYSIHGLGNDNYFRLDFPVNIAAEDGDLLIPFTAALENVLLDFNLNETVFSHGEVGLAHESLVNMAEHVFTLNESAILSAQSLDQPKTFTVFPNPAKGSSFQMHFDDSRGNYRVSISDIQGKTVKEGPVFSDRPISIGNLTEGLYLVSLFRGSDRQSVRKLVIH